MRYVVAAAGIALIVTLSSCSGPPRYVTGDRSPSAPEGRVASEAGRGRWRAISREVAGVPYRYGGTSRQGFDCSGLVQYAYRAYDGTRLPRTVSALFQLGEPVRQDALRPGDLLFYRTRGHKPSHVGIYLGDDRFLHASTSNGVITSALDESYYRRRYLGARRLSD